VRERHVPELDVQHLLASKQLVGAVRAVGLVDLGGDLPDAQQHIVAVLQRSHHLNDERMDGRMTG